MFCNKCGKKIPDDSTFCNYCGAEISASVHQPSPETEEEQPVKDLPPEQGTGKPAKNKSTLEEETGPTKKTETEPEMPTIKPDKPDDEKAKTKKLVLIISIAASVVLLGIILAGSLLLKKAGEGGGNDADNSFHVSRETADAAAESTGTVEQSTDAEESAAEETAAADGVQRIIVWDNAIEGLTASDQPRYDNDLRSAYSIQEVCDKCDIWGSEGVDVKIIGSDGYVGEEPLNDILKKYLTLEGDDEPVFVGEAQDPGQTVWEVAYINFGTDAIMTSYRDRINVSDVFEALGMVEADSYDFICTDEYTFNVAAGDIGECYISWIDGRVDAEVPGIGDSSLYSILYIQPGA